MFTLEIPVTALEAILNARGAEILLLKEKATLLIFVLLTAAHAQNAAIN